MSNSGKLSRRKFVVSVGASAVAATGLLSTKPASADGPDPKRPRFVVPVDSGPPASGFVISPEQQMEAEKFGVEIELMRPYMKVEDFVPSLHLDSDEALRLGVSEASYETFARLVQVGAEQLRAIPLEQRRQMAAAISTAGAAKVLPQNRTNYWLYCGYVDRRIIEGGIVLAIIYYGGWTLITGIGAIVTPPPLNVALGTIAAFLGFHTGVTLTTALWIVQAFYPPNVWICI